MARNFMELLKARWAESKFVCVGLDSEFDKIPKSAHQSGNECDVSIANTIVEFNRRIVEATKDLVCAYKPNSAFYEAYGSEGINALWRTIADIRFIAPEVPVILDYKRGDIGNTNTGYVKAAFNFMGADAVTVHPYLGAEALNPFLAQADKGVIVLCRTSNPGAGEFQDMDVSGDMVPGGYMPFYKYVAHRVSQYWNKNNNCAVVVGATYPSELHEVRQTVGDLPILIPGIGAQGGDLERTVAAGKNSKNQGMIINSSRGIIFASSGEDFAKAAAAKAKELRDAINNAIPA